MQLVRAETASPYFDGLSSVVTRAFGVPLVLATPLSGIAGIHATVQMSPAIAPRRTADDAAMLAR